MLGFRGTSERTCFCVSTRLLLQWAWRPTCPEVIGGPTLAVGGQPVGRLPVLVAPQDVVGDVDVTGSHVVNPLRNGHAS